MKANKLIALLLSAVMVLSLCACGNAPVETPTEPATQPATQPQTEPVTPDGKHTDVAYVCLRIGGGDAFVDNYHSGGMATAVDLETGCIVTDGVNELGKIIASHPKTGVTFKGFKIPYFKEALAMVTEACEKNKLSAYIGWDVAISENGPVLIEVNQRPGSMLLTAPWISEKRGMKHVMEKYL